MTSRVLRAPAWPGTLFFNLFRIFDSSYIVTDTFALFPPSLFRRLLCGVVFFVAVFLLSSSFALRFASLPWSCEPLRCGLRLLPLKRSSPAVFSRRSHTAASHHSYRSATAIVIRRAEAWDCRAAAAAVDRRPSITPLCRRFPLPSHTHSVMSGLSGGSDATITLPEGTMQHDTKGIVRRVACACLRSSSPISISTPRFRLSFVSAALSVVRPVVPVRRSRPVCARRSWIDRRYSEHDARRRCTAVCAAPSIRRRFSGHRQCHAHIHSCRHADR